MKNTPANPNVGKKRKFGFIYSRISDLDLLLAHHTLLPPSAQRTCRPHYRSHQPWHAGGMPDYISLLFCLTLPLCQGFTPFLELESRKRLAFRDVTGKSIWKERLPWTTTFFYKRSSKRRKGFPSETNVKRGFPRRAWGQGAVREARQE